VRGGARSRGIGFPLRWASAAAALTLLGPACGARWPAEQELRADQGEQRVAAAEGTPGETTWVGEGVSFGAEGTLSPGTGGGSSEASGRVSTPRPSGFGGSGTGSAKIDPGPHPGVSDTEIKLCYLVALTGAAPIPTSWDKGANLYWKYLKDKGRTIHGRNVALMVGNTDSKVDTGLSAARECINQGAFTFVVFDRAGVEGPIAKFLNDKGMPHVLVEASVSAAAPDQTNSFTISVDHRMQGKLIADYWTNGDLAGKKYAYVREDVPDLIPAVEALKARLAEKGIHLVAEERVKGDDNDFSQTVLNLEKADAQVVWYYGAPTPLIKLAQQSHAVSYDPVWFGNSISWGFNTVAQVGNANGALKGARAFSAWVALSNPAANTYKAAYRETYTDPNDQPDDIGLVGWGVGEVMHAALLAAGSDLGYKTFRSAFQSLNIAPQTWCPLRFGPGVRVGANYVAEYRIAGDHWNQVGGFRSSF